MATGRRGIARGGVDGGGAEHRGGGEGGDSRREGGTGCRRRAGCRRGTRRGRRRGRGVPRLWSGRRRRWRPGRRVGGRSHRTPPRRARRGSARRARRRRNRRRRTRGTRRSSQRRRGRRRSPGRRRGERGERSGRGRAPNGERGAVEVRHLRANRARGRGEGRARARWRRRARPPAEASGGMPDVSAAILAGVRASRAPARGSGTRVSASGYARAPRPRRHEETASRRRSTVRTFAPSLLGSVESSSWGARNRGDASTPTCDQPSGRTPRAHETSQSSKPRRSGRRRVGA